MKTLTQEHRNHIGQALKGKKQSPETRAKRSASMKGRACPPETRAKIGNANRGRKFSAEVRERMSQSRRREKNYRWKGGIGIGKGGYLRISIVGPDGRTIRRNEHIVIAEQVLGRHLREGEVVHHINGDKLDNRHCNLLICDRSYHRWLETKMADLYKREHFSTAERAQ